MKYAVASGLGFWPTGGPAEYGLPANWQEEGYCIDRWREAFLPVGTAHIGRTVSIPIEARAIQLLPDGFQAATEVYVIFRPKETHVHTYGSQPVRMRAGDILPVPWLVRQPNRFNATVEVYPVAPALASLSELDSHYAKFGVIECCHGDDAVKLAQGHQCSLNWLRGDITLGTAFDPTWANPALPADSGLPGLRCVPCSGMRWGLLECAGYNHTGAVVAGTERDYSGGYFVTVLAGSRHTRYFPVLPLGFVPPAYNVAGSQGGTFETHFMFPIPPMTDYLSVHAHLYNRAVTLHAVKGSLTVFGGPMVQLHLSSLEHVPAHWSARDGIAADTVYDATVEKRCIATITRPTSKANADTLFYRAYPVDAGGHGLVWNLHTFMLSTRNVRAYNDAPHLAWDEDVFGLAGAPGNVVTMNDRIDYCWDAAILTGSCATAGQSVDAVYAKLYTAGE